VNPIASAARCLLLEMQLKNVRYTEGIGFHVPEADGELGDWDIESQLRLLLFEFVHFALVIFSSQFCWLGATTPKKALVKEQYPVHNPKIGIIA